ncbi:hypothetical protein [Pelomonas cellulosilytica]|uniref:Uncharacterized protein n=1 Tax=Pelomonas cellulosilytica TaxID=2906762 RepID=A0ABS8Y3V5_9BURK|nr:hypothetical protein [Pelomonas sp. P8]MCE4557879.1 hypothetical protein [Pelomonas sp. P8]
MNSKILFLLGLLLFWILAAVGRFIANTEVAAFAKNWFVFGAIVQYLCSLPMQKHASNLHGYLASVGKKLPKNRDQVLAAAAADPWLIPNDLLMKYNVWQAISIFLAGPLLCSIVIMALSFIKFV